MPDAIYIISGCMRSFTSMMMHSVEAGGMTCVYDRERDQWKDAYKRDGYDPNKDGLREMSDAQLGELRTHPASFSGKVIKLLSNYGAIPVPRWEGRYKVLFLLRDPLEIAESFERFFGKKMEYVDGEEKLPFTPQLYARLIDSTMQDAAERGDMDVQIVGGMRILEDPLKFFKMLAGTWPIDAQKAAAIVDPSRRRVRAA